MKFFATFNTPLYGHYQLHKVHKNVLDFFCYVRCNIVSLMVARTPVTFCFKSVISRIFMRHTSRIFVIFDLGIYKHAVFNIIMNYLSNDSRLTFIEFLCHIFCQKLKVNIYNNSHFIEKENRTMM